MSQTADRHIIHPFTERKGIFMSKSYPLSVLLEDARTKTVAAFNQILESTKLPAYLYEGMLLEVLAEVRNRKNLELLADMHRMEEKEEEAKQEEARQEPEEKDS